MPTLSDWDNWIEQSKAKFAPYEVPIEEREQAITEGEVGQYPGDDPEKFLKSGRKDFAKLKSDRLALTDQVKKARAKEKELHPYPKLERAFSAITGSIPPFLSPDVPQEQQGMTPDTVAPPQSVPGIPPPSRQPIPQPKAAGSRFALDNGSIIDTKRQEPVTRDQFEMLANPRERDEIDRQMQSAAQIPALSTAAPSEPSRSSLPIPPVNQALESMLKKVNRRSAELDRDRKGLDAMQAQMDALEPKLQIRTGQQPVMTDEAREQYESLRQTFNQKVEAFNKNRNDFNALVKKYNLAVGDHARKQVTPQIRPTIDRFGSSMDFSTPDTLPASDGKSASIQFTDRAGNPTRTVTTTAPASTPSAMELGREFGRGVRRGVSQTGALLVGGASALAGAVGARDTADTWMKTYDALQKDAAAYPSSVSWDQALSSPGAFLSYSAGALGEQVPVMASVVATGGVGSLVGRLIGKGIINRAAGQAAIQAADKWALHGGFSGAAAAGSALEAGGIYGEQREAGLEPSPKTALVGGAVSGILESAVPYALARAAGLGPAFTSTFMRTLQQKGLLTRMASLGAGAAVGEGATEAAQEAVAIAARRFVDRNYDALGPEVSNRILQSAVTGAIVGGPFGSMAGVSKPRNVHASESQFQPEPKRLDVGALRETPLRFPVQQAPTPDQLIRSIPHELTISPRSPFLVKRTPTAIQASVTPESVVPSVVQPAIQQERAADPGITQPPAPHVTPEPIGREPLVMNPAQQAMATEVPVTPDEVARQPNIVQEQAIPTTPVPLEPESREPMIVQRPTVPTGLERIDLTGAGKAIVDNLYDHLWSRVQAGKVTEQDGFKPSAHLQAAKEVYDAGGIENADDLRAFINEIDAVASPGMGLKGKQRDREIRRIIQDWTPKRPEAIAQDRARQIAEKTEISPPSARGEASLEGLEIPSTRGVQGPSVDEIHAAAEAKGIAWDNDRDFMDLTESVTGKRHLDDLTGPERTAMMQAIDAQPIRQPRPYIPGDPITAGTRAEPAPVQSANTSRETSTHPLAVVERMYQDIMDDSKVVFRMKREQKEDWQVVKRIDKVMQEGLKNGLDYDQAVRLVNPKDLALLETMLSNREPKASPREPILTPDTVMHQPSRQAGESKANTRAADATPKTDIADPMVQQPRSELPIADNMEMQLRAEKASADLEIVGKETGRRKIFDYSVQGQGGTPDVIRLQSAAPDWYTDLTTGPRPLKRQQIDAAIQKIIKDHGVDVGTAVERVKEALLRDREFNRTPWGKDADAIARGEWPSWIEKPAGIETAPRQEASTPEQVFSPSSEREAEPSRSVAQIDTPPTPDLVFTAHQPNQNKKISSTPKSEQMSIDVPPETIGSRPIIGREAQPEEAPLFSKAAQERDVEQTVLPGTAPDTVSVPAEKPKESSDGKPKLYTSDVERAEIPTSPTVDPAQLAFAKKGSAVGFDRHGNTITMGYLPKSKSYTVEIATPSGTALSSQRFGTERDARANAASKIDRDKTRELAWWDVSQLVGRGTSTQIQKKEKSATPDAMPVKGEAKRQVGETPDEVVTETKLQPRRQHVKQIEERFGDVLKEEFGISPQSLTAPEAAYLVGFRDADALRARAIKASSERVRRLSGKGISRAEDHPVNPATSSSDPKITELGAPDRDANAVPRGTEPSSSSKELADLFRQESADLYRKKSPKVPRIPVAPITGGPSVPLGDMILNLEKGTGKKLMVGKTKGGTAGVYKPGSSATIIKYSGDLDTTAHEMSHALDHQYGLVKEWNGQDTSPFDVELEPFWQHGSSDQNTSATYNRAEGVAEYLRAWMVNPDAAEAAAPKFTAHVKAKLPAEIQKAIKTFSTQIRQWAGHTAHAKIMANVQWETPETGLTHWLTGTRTAKGPGFQLTFGDQMATVWTDRLAPFVKALKYARGQRGIEDESILPGNNPDLLARLFMGVNAKLDDIFSHGMVDSRLERATPGGLSWLLEPLDQSSSKSLEDSMQEVASLMIAQRTIEKSEQLGKKRVSGIGAGIEDDVSVAEARLAELKKDEARYAKLKEAASRYRQWADANLRYLVDKGRLSQEQYEGIKANNEQYVAMQRILEVSPGEELVTSIPRGGPGRKIGSVGTPVQTFKGSTRAIKNPYLSLMDATHRSIREADRNEILKLFRDLLTTDRGLYEGEPNNLATVGREAQAGEQHTIPIFVNGKKESWQFHPDIYKALKGIEEGEYKLPPVLTVLPRILRATIVNAPPFALRNIIRDAWHRSIVSLAGSKPWDTLKVYSKDEISQLKRSGGDQAGHYYTDAKNYARAMKFAMEEAVASHNSIVVNPAKLMTWAKKGAQGYLDLMQGSERQGRLSEYRRAFAKAKRAFGYDDYHAMLYAASQSRSLIDYAIAGNWMLLMNQMIPFSNAAVQGLRSSALRAKADPAGYALRFGAFALAPTLMTYAWNYLYGDDDLDEYRQLPAYQRDLFWNFKLGPDLWLKVPKPFENGVMASSFERMLDYAMGNPKAFDGHVGSMAKTLLPVDEASFAGPYQAVFQAAANYDFFRDRPIVPRWEENLALDLRSYHRASRLGQALQQAIGVDARKIDFVIQQQFGYLGRYASDISDTGRKDKHGLTLSASGLTGGSPASVSLDAKEVSRIAEERGVVPSRSKAVDRITNMAQITPRNAKHPDSLRYAVFRKHLNEYYKAESREDRDRLAKQVRADAKHLMDLWEKQPPRPEADDKIKKKRALESEYDPLLDLLGVPQPLSKHPTSTLHELVP